MRPEPFHGPDHLGLGPVHRDLDDPIDQVVTGRAPQRPRALLDGAGQRRGTILEVAGLQRRGDRGDGRLVQCRPQLAVVGRFDRLEGAREVDAAAEVRAEAPAAVVDLEMVHQGAERLARIAASGPLPLQRPDPRLQKSPVPARPGDLQRRRQDRRRAEPVRALLQERLQLVARRGVAAVGQRVQDERPALLVKIAALERLVDQVDRLRRAQPHHRLERPRRRHAAQGLDPARQHRQVGTPSVPSQVRRHQLRRQVVLVEQVWRQEIGRLFRVMPRQTLGGPVADLRVFEAQEAPQIVE